jgi:Tol biopolymer transport system component
VFTSLRDGDYEIYTMEPDGSSPRRLSNHPASDRQPASDIFDSQIVFTSDRDGNNEIYLMYADGSNVRRITNNAASDHSPVFTTDGGAILFVSDRDGNSELYLVGLVAVYGYAERRMTTYQYEDLDPTIVMFPSRIQATAHSRFRVIDPQSGAGDYDLRVQSESGTEIWTGTSAEDREPSWSGDGQNLVFTAVDTQGFQTLWIWDRINSARSLGRAQASNGSWSPWQDEIAFATTRTGNGEIFMMKTDGSAATNLSNNAAWDGEPHWH